MEHGLRRVTELARLIGQMCQQGHPKLADLVDVPNPDQADTAHWAELRVNATTDRRHDTRNFRRPIWMPAVGMAEAADTTCRSVGYNNGKAMAA